MKVLSETADFSLIQDPEFENIDWDWNTIETRVTSQNLPMILNKPVSWPRLSARMKFECIETHIDSAPWCFKTISQRPDLEKGFVRKHADRPWPSSTLTWSGAVEESIADEDGIHAREVWQSMSSTCISPEFLRHHIDKEWDFRKLGKHNPDACIQVMMDPHKPWDYDEIAWSGSQNVVDFAIRYPHQPFPTWKISFMATLETVSLNPQYNWDWSKVFTKWQQGDSVKSTRAAIVIQSSWRRVMAKKRVAALTIWNAYIRAKYDPNYRMCKSFIARQTKEYSMSSRVITRVSKALELSSS
jgi:hypothetical protein